MAMLYTIRHILLILVAFGGNASLSVAEDQDPHIDVEQSVDSKTCLVCHNGVLARHMTIHPSEVNYLEALLNDRGALKPIADLPSSIPLAGDRVSVSAATT